MKNKLNIALITAGNPRHHYFKKKISSVVDVGLVIEEPKKSTPQEKEISFFKNSFLDNNCNSKRNNQVNISDKTLNNIETQKILEDFSPDYIFTFGCGLLKDNIIKTASKCTINIHTGLTQYHRGVEGPLFAIYEEDASIIGSTIHQVTTGIDSGQVVAQEKTKLRLDDDLELLFYRTCKCGIDLLQKYIINIILDKAKFKTLNKGKLYQKKDVTDEIIMSANSKIGRVLYNYYDLDGAAGQFICY